jgi:hypothetical protein
MLLGQKNELNSSFAQFWKILEGMLDHLSQPVAFATAPLHSSKSETHSFEKPQSGSSATHRSIPPAKQHAATGSTEHEIVEDSSAEMDESWELDSEGV